MGNFCCIPTQPQPAVKYASIIESMSFNMNGKLRHPIAEIYFRSDFRANRDALARTLYSQFNNTVFNNLLPTDMKIYFSYMESNSGTTHISIYPDGSFFCEIELSILHMEHPQRVRDTLLHEMCHVAVHCIDLIEDPTDSGHGSYWKRWTEHAKSIYPFINIEKFDNTITFTRCIYTCNECDHEIARKLPLAPDQTCPICRCGTFKLMHSYTDPYFINMQEKSCVAPKGVPASPIATLFCGCFLGGSKDSFILESF